MSRDLENETWIIDAGDAVIQKQARNRIADLAPHERLILCLWVADYSMRNAGDLDTAGDLHPGFQYEAARIAEELSLKFTHDTFLPPKESLEREYFDRIDRVCDEIKDSPRSSATLS